MADATQVYGTLCTDIGNAAIANSVLNGTKVNFSQIAVGDANGVPYTPTSSMTALRHQVWSGAIADMQQDPQQANRMILHAVLPSSVGGWTMREIGVLDDQGRLIAVGNTPEIPKESITSGAVMEVDLYIYITVVDTRGVNIVIDPTVIIATKSDVQRVADRVTKLESNSYPKRYGVRWPVSGTNPTGERTADAVGLVAAAGTDTTAPKNDFDSIMPWSGRRECNGYFSESGDFTVTAYKGEPGFSATGANGDVYVETPLFYYRDCVDGSYDVLEISMFQYDGFLPSPHCIKVDGTLRTHSYSPKYNLKMVNAIPTSISGVFSDYGSLNDMMTNAAKKGSGYIVETTAEHFVDTVLAVVEFATRDLQSIMQGACAMPYSDTTKALVAETSVNRIIVDKTYASRFIVGQAISISATGIWNDEIARDRIVTSVQSYDANSSAIYFDGATVTTAVGDFVGSRPWKNGATDSVIASSGSPVSNSDGLHPCIYRGKENPWGNVWCYYSDIVVKREGSEGAYTYTPYHLADPRKYSSGSITSDYTRMDYQLPSADGFQTKLGKDPRFPWIRFPTENTGSSSTRFCDYYWYPRADGCVALFGGDVHDGAGDGPFDLYCGDLPSDVYWNLRARLSHVTG